MAKAKPKTVTPAKAKMDTAKNVSIAANPAGDDDRQRMVSEAAYYLAEHRGFGAGGELGDWLQAEQQVDERLGRHEG